MSADEPRALSAGKPVKIAVPCAGIPAGGAVSVKIFERGGLGQDPIETLQATVDKKGSVAVASWTYDYSKYKEKVASSVFWFVVEGAGRVSIAGPVAFLETFKATIKDAAGHPAADRVVFLHPDRGSTVTTRTNEAGQVRAEVPPADYVVELGGPVPPGSPPGPPVEEEPGSESGKKKPGEKGGGAGAGGGDADEKEDWAVRLEWNDAAKAVAAVILACDEAKYRKESPRASAKLDGDHLVFPFPEGPSGSYTVTLRATDGDEVLVLEDLALQGSDGGGPSSGIGTGARAGGASSLADEPTRDGAGPGAGAGEQTDPSYFCGDPTAVPHESCFELDGAHFDFDSSFVRKDGIEALSTVHDTLEQDAQRLAMVHGHTDTVGSEDYNKQLSERRARAVLAVLTQDPAAWEELYATEGWGTRKVQVILNAVRGGDEPEIGVDGDAGPETQGAIRRFQQRTDHAPLPVTGTADKATRRELFLAYMKRASAKPLDAARFKDFGGSRFMGCGEFNPFAEGKDEKSRRVTLLVFDPSADPGTLPCKVGDVAPCKKNLLGPNEPPRGQPDDKTPFFRCKVFRELSKKCPCCQGGGDSGLFRYALDVGGSRWPDDAVLRIESEDGSHVQTFGIGDGARKANLREFTFDETRKGVRYKGQIQTNEGGIFGLFGLVELAKILDPADATNVLPLPDVTAEDEQPAPAFSPADVTPDPPGYVNQEAVDKAALLLDTPVSPPIS